MDGIKKTWAYYSLSCWKDFVFLPLMECNVNVSLGGEQLDHVAYTENTETNPYLFVIFGLVKQFGTGEGC